MRFWKHKLGSQKVETFLPQHYKQHNLANYQKNDSIGTENIREEFDDKEEIVIEISREEMKVYHDESNQGAFRL